jgi:ATP synthase I subunit
MTDEAQIRQRAIAGIIKGVAKKTALLTVGAAAAVLVYTLLQDAGQRWWLLPASVLFGGALGLLNFRWLATAVERVYLRKGATPGLSSLAAAVISILKLSLIFIILFMVIKWQVLHIFGMVAGLSLSFLAIVWEGAKLMKQTLQDGGSGR